MKPIVFMTTYNRPELLAQSLPQVENEALSIGADFYIHDDQSDSTDTLALLAEAGARDIHVFRRDYDRMQTNMNGHELTGLANVHGFKYLLNEDPSWTHMIKVDDDTFWHPGGMRTMIEQYEKAESDGVDILWLSGISTVNEEEMEDHCTYAVTNGCCNAAVIYRREDIESFLNDVPLPYIINDGFDSCILWRWAPKFRPNGKSVTVKPSVVYHTGITGVHVRDMDLNRNFIGGVDGIICK